MHNNIFKDTILFSDIDGTLMTYKKELPKRNLEAIKHFQQGGGKFTICTGRSVESLRRAIDVSILNFPAIVFNGGGIYDYENEKFLKDSVLNQDVRHFVDEIFEKYPDIGIEINVDDVLYCVKYSERSNRHILTERDEFKLYSMDSIPDGQWKKVLFTGEKRDIDILSEDFLLRNTEGKDYYFLRSEPGLFELLPASAKKGLAVFEISEMYSVPIKNVFAIGDYFNDITMLEAAGTACAVSGSPKEVMDIADYISCPCEDGAVADFISYIEQKRINKG